MTWLNYLACFGAGLFLANSVPHWVNGVSGNGFPTPFAHPPGKGLSSPLVNVVWALCNAVAGYVLFRAGRISVVNTSAMLVFFAGVAVISVMSSVHFAKKQTS